MSVQMHTPEPWSAEFGEAVSIKAADGGRVAIATNLCLNSRRSANEVEANARRIVACVNACRHIASSLLERINRNSVQGIHPQPQKRISELEDQRDELLSALKEAVDCGMVPRSSALDGGAVKHARQVHVADQIRAAIAKSEAQS